MNKRLSLIKFVLRIFISLVLVFYVLRFLDLHLLYKTLFSIEPLIIFQTLLLSLFSIVLMVLKWRLFIKEDKTKFDKLLSVYLGASFTSLFGLGMLGSDSYKVFSFPSKKNTFLSVFLDRIFSFAWYLIAALILLFFYSFSIKDKWFLIFSMAYLVLSIFFVQIVVFSTRGNSWFAFRALFKHSLFCVMHLLNVSLIIFLLARGFGVGISYFLSMLFTPILLVGLTLPISIQGVGIREYLFYRLSIIQGVDYEKMISISIAMFVLSILVNLIGIVPFFSRLGIKLEE